MKMLKEKLMAHRGARSEAPENTIVSFQKAHELGARAFEIDATLLKDGTVVTFHDDLVDRCTDGTGNIADFNRVSVKKLDAGSYMGEQFKETRIPYFEESLEYLNAINPEMHIEIKVNEAISDRKFELAEKTLRIADDKLDSLEKIIFTSFDTEVLAHVRKIMPSAATGWNRADLADNWRERSQELGICSLQPFLVKLRAEEVKEVRKAGYAVVIYTNFAPVAEVLFDCGVSAICTDFLLEYPQLLHR
jgi:glycerophosphoryl diester phosphodiesterase